MPYLNFEGIAFTKESLFAEMDRLPKHSIAHTWQEYKTSCQVDFSIAGSSDCLLVKYYVSEDSFRVVSREINSAVHKDNCVELFIAFEDDKSYYNIEFNCLGIGKMAYGKGRLGRSFVPPEIVNQIGTHTQLKTLLEGGVYWEILMSIPLKVFYFHSLASLKGGQARANFYKCGDDLPVPHYLSWNKVRTLSPDFHSPEYFGKLFFLM